MSSAAQGSVVILYEHALLGEGIARHILARCGLRATVAPVHELDAVTSALAGDPSVVIFELTEPLEQGTLETLAPQAVLIDVTGAVTRGPAVAAPGPAGLERIVQAVRALPSAAAGSA